MRKPCLDTVINWPAISLSILLRAEGPANNEVMNSQSDLTIDLLFTIVTANAFNDPPARSHPRQGAQEAPGLWGILWVTLVVSNKHPILSLWPMPEARKQGHDNMYPPLTTPTAQTSPPREVTSPLSLQRTAISPKEN